MRTRLFNLIKTSTMVCNPDYRKHYTENSGKPFCALYSVLIERKERVKDFAERLANASKNKKNVEE